MAHFILEYSTNLDKQKLNLPVLFEKLHNAMVDTGIYPIAGIRSRAHPCDDFRVASGNPDFSFVHLNFRIGAGRSADEHEVTLNAMKQVLVDHLEPLFSTQGLAASFEITELSPTLRYNHNNIRDYLS